MNFYQYTCLGASFIKEVVNWRSLKEITKFSISNIDLNATESITLPRKSVGKLSDSSVLNNNKNKVGGCGGVGVRVG